MSGVGPQIGRDAKLVQSIKAQSVNGTVNGSIVDTAGFDEAVILLNLGTAGGNVDVKVQEDDDPAGGTMADIASAAFSQKTAATDDASYQATLRMEAPRKRYIRVVAVTSAGSLLSADVLLCQPMQKPAVAQSALGFAV